MFIFFNIIFNIISPILLQTTRYQHFGDYSAVFFLAFTGYAILKKNLFSTRILTGYLFIGFTGSALLVDVLLLSKGTAERLIELGLLFFFLLFGYMLIRSFYNEMRQKKMLEEAHGRLEQAYKELKQLDEAKTEFLSIASHQLRTPISVVKGYISMVLEGDYGKVPDKLLAVLEKSDENITRLSHVVGDLLNAARIDAGRLGLNYSEEDIFAIIDDAVDELTSKAEERGIKLVWKHDESAAPILSYLDKEKMQQVIVNLIDNAISYTPEGSVTVEARIESDGIVISVIDTGIGIPKADQKKIFDKFTRSQKARLIRPDGTGIGLHVVKTITEAHNGKVWLESKEDKGTTFYVRFPILKEKLENGTPEDVVELAEAKLKAHREAKEKIAQELQVD